MFKTNPAIGSRSTIEYFAIAFATVSSGGWRVRSSKSYDEPESHPSLSYPNCLRGAVAGHGGGFVTICSAPDPHFGISHLLSRPSSLSSPGSENADQVKSTRESILLASHETLEAQCRPRHQPCGIPQLNMYLYLVWLSQLGIMNIVIFSEHCFG